MAVSLAAAVILRAGVVPSQFGWTALGVSIAACLALARAPLANTAANRAVNPAAVILTLLLGWMLLQMAPLPAAWVVHLSPYRYGAVQSARALLGQPPAAWMALSTAPAATLNALLFVAPAMAAFLTVGEMARWWPGRLWVVAAPVLVLATLEAVLGLVQFFLMRTAGGPADFVSGTYAAYDHYSGFLEMAFPFAVMGALSLRDGTLGVSSALRSSALFAAAACLFMAIVVSLSRMGMVSTLVSTAVILAAFAFGRERGSRWLRLVPIVIPLLLLASVSTRELLLRFAELTAKEGISSNVRTQIWSDTLRVISAYPWTGCGLGAFERGMYQFKTAAPANTVDFAHDDYLQMTAELGVPGVLLLGALVVLVLGRTLRVVLFQRKNPNWYVACGLLGAIVAIAVHSLADFNLYVPANALAFAWLAGMSMSLTAPAASLVSPAGPRRP